ncbi:hypothetical protein EZJ19_01210 [Parasulfuritortus cantonensis]|uniref:ATP-grasp domain-containing protein n=1 Tax=Parasulfuritortus cantonensis TaxID=2528202 RepID=A0A4R1BRF9_9PROT|nr:hypothetical protein [Parasulfuritortus cantonensis]TCJ19775.1 hypothetical protein EZJ19_01210 [Parasulfuritortus cantonensis]
MICIVMTWPRDTHRSLSQYPGAPKVQVWSYDALFRARRLPRATWLFTDMDRLGFWELELAAHAYRELAGHGMPVLNDPGRFCGRFDLLERLHGAGVNRFRVWRPGRAAAVDRWPVFLRTEAAHRGPLTGLITAPEALAAAIEAALAAGYPERDLMIVEYCAEPIRDNLFRKHAAFRVGARIVTSLAVHDTGWAAKYGVEGVAGSELYREELANLAENGHADVLMRAFETAHLEYGRVDYALVAGTPQIYEINSNPSIGHVVRHPDPARLESARLWERNFAAALAAIDSAPGPSVTVGDARLRKQRRRDRLMLRSRWVV